MSQELPTITNYSLDTNTSSSDTTGFTSSSNFIIRSSSFSTVIDPSKWQESYKEEESMNVRRIVRVFIIDPDQNIPLEKALLYESDEFLTDATNQELFYEVPIKELLGQHNKYRTTVLDKEATKRLGKETYLEPIRIRDLKMVVVDIAVF